MEVNLVEHTLRSLDWYEFEEWLRSFLYTEAGIRALEKEEFLSDKESVIQALDTLDEYLKLVEERSSPPLYYMDELSRILSLIEKNGELQKEDFVSLRSFLFLLREMKNFFSGIDFSKYPHLEVFKGFCDYDVSLTVKFDKIFDPSGEIRDNASPELIRLYGELKKAGESVRATLQSILNDREWKQMLQDRYFTLRDGRYVLPLKRNFMGKVRGIVHGLSSTGNTAYFEPDLLFNLNNRIQTLHDDIEREKRRILSEFYSLLKSHISLLRELYDLIGRLDLLNAKSQIVRETGGIKPEITDKMEISIVDGRHPLLLKKRVSVVPNSIFMDFRKPALIITGPNAGGKTVFLKMIGLFHLMIKRGIFIPSESARTYVPEKVMAEIGDYQSIGEDASTFSSHLITCDRFYRDAGKGDLVLIDEIMMGTDQEEGSFLAMSFLTKFVDKGVLIAVTTHYTYLKMLPLLDERFEIAKMDFDFQKFKPLYRIVYGSTGMSFPLQIAKFLGVSREVIEEAERFKNDLGSEEGKLFLSLVKKEKEMEKKLEEILQKEKILEEEGRKLRESLKRKEEELEDRWRKEKEKVATRLRELESEVKKALSEFQKEKRPVVLTKAGNRVRVEMKNLLDSGPQSGEKLNIGDLAEYRGLGVVGKVVEVDEKRVKIVYRGKEFVGKPQMFRKVGESREEENYRKEYSLKQAGYERVDVRGMISEEAIAEIEKKLNELVLKNFSGKLIVIHGHGTGVLKKRIREYLKDHQLVEKWRPGELEEGGDGVTVIEI